MKIVMTLMVRDEADIVGSMLEHHFAQGVDHVIVTDNGSIDGTVEILEGYAAKGLITLHRDPTHEKQQSVVVTKMAREAAVTHDATWVLNADADEFWVAEASDRTLREALAEIPTDFRAFDVPVIDMTGDPALAGSGLGRLRYRDLRSTEEINALGLHAHATHDVVHVGDPQVEVAQGNHFVNIQSQGEPEPGEGIEVLHLPWRSWTQFRMKVENAGSAYKRSNLTPSPNHHGMRDFRRLQAGTLYALYLARHPTREERLEDPKLLEDRRLSDQLTEAVPDEPIPEEERRMLAAIARSIVVLENEARDLKSSLKASDESLQQRQNELQARSAEIEVLLAELTEFRGSRVLKVANAVSRWVPFLRR